MNQQKKVIDVIIPSWENQRMCEVAKQSIIANTTYNLRFYKFQDPLFNKGWMKRCNEGITESLESNDSDYILLSNDDIIVSPVNDWAHKMVRVLQSFKDVGAVSCLTNNACGWARFNENHIGMLNIEFFKVPYISHFFVLLNKEAVKKVGLLDEKLIGGDDIDYSIRLNDAGYMTTICPKIFVWHHYGQTGKRIYGQYWDSQQHTEDIQKALIRKHGFKKYVYTLSNYQEEENGKEDRSNSSHNI